MAGDAHSLPEPLAVATARAVAARSVLPVPAGPGEGAPARRQALVDEALRAGLLAAPGDGEAVDQALWGAELGDDSSLAVLGELARSCAGAGLALHAAALGARLQREVGAPADAPAVVAAPIAPRCPPLEVLEEPAAAGGAWVPDAGAGKGGTITASFPFVWGPAGAGVLLAFVRVGAGWALCRVRVDGKGGVQVREDERRRLGLRACALLSVQLEGVPTTTLVRHGEPARALLHAHLRRLWLGLAALAAGTADAAVQEAARYAGERFQGGGPIAGHAAVQALLGEAAARAQTARAAMAHAHAAQGLADVAALRLAVGTDAALAVTSALQVMGGNGYMEDFPLAKRLRDVESLRVTQGTPDDLRRIVAVAAARRVG